VVVTVLLDDAEVVAGTAAVAVVVLEDEAVVVLESAAEVWVVTLAVGDVVTVGPAVVVAAPERIVNPLTNPTSATTLPTSVALRARAAGCLRRLRTPRVVFMPRPSLIGLATP
jgi:translation initiation factor 6 (eIF-6)